MLTTSLRNSITRDDYEPTPNTQTASAARVMVSLFAFDEGDKLRRTLARFPSERQHDVVIVDDGSTDGSVNGAERLGFTVLRNERNEGLGASIKRALRHALANQYDIVVIMAGNGKDDPTEIERLVEPIVHRQYDFVQGSRFLDGGAYGNMPWLRSLATKVIHPWLFSILSGTRVTESTNGFRAFRTAILRDPRIDWHQPWLDQYELEQYLHFKVVELGYKRLEVPVSKVYPTKARGYTKVKPITGWWSMVKPLVYLAFGFRK